MMQAFVHSHDRLFPGFFTFQSDTRSFNPETFQIIEFSVWLVKKMNDHISVIHQYPVTFPFSFNAIGSKTFFTHSFLKMLGYGLHLPAGASTCNEKVVAD